MPSPFFRRIAETLVGRGCGVSAITLCFGDWYFWHAPGQVKGTGAGLDMSLPSTAYRGRASRWASFLAAYIKQHHVTDLVLLGEQRDYHKVAVAVAKIHGVRVTVTDFGYLRSDWITLERDGMGGNSVFPRSLGEITALAETAPAVNLAGQYGDNFWAMAKGDLIYSFGNVFLGWLYPFYRQSVRRAHPFIYFPAMAVRLWGAKARQSKALQQISQLQSESYYLFPLQLEHDFQIIAYSPFTGLEEPIRLVMTSFAENAPAATRLVIKPHPWDPSLKSWPRLIARLARSLGIADRVDYIDGGTLDEVAEKSLGVVTINSTSGLRALQLGLPVKVLGQAVYDMAGLTFQGGLDDFWQSAILPATTPAAPSVTAFVKALAATTQLRGVFFNEPGLTAAVEAASERLFHQTVGQVIVEQGA